MGIGRCALRLLLMLVGLAAAGCSKEVIECESLVYVGGAGSSVAEFLADPANDPVAVTVVKKVMEDSMARCGTASKGCEFSVGKARYGWSIAVTTLRPTVDGRCAGLMGGEKYFTFDEGGNPYDPASEY